MYERHEYDMFPGFWPSAVAKAQAWGYIAPRPRRDRASGDQKDRLGFARSFTTPSRRRPNTINIPTARSAEPLLFPPSLHPRTSASI